MSSHQPLAEQFEANRAHLTAVAYRMLGSLGEAEDAVQESWLRLSHADASAIQNLRGWLATVVSRVCLDVLRSRQSRSEEPLDDEASNAVTPQAVGGDPERESQMAEGVGLALLVVLDRLAPAERLAFVLHDAFAVPFEEIAPLVGRSTAAARQLASRARRRVQGTSNVPHAELLRQREVVEAFLTAMRRRDFEGLLAVLDPNVVRRADRVAAPAEAAREIRSADAVAKEALAHTNRAHFARAALVNGDVGIVVAPRGRLLMVLRCAFLGGKIAEFEVITEPSRLRQLDLAV